MVLVDGIYGSGQLSRDVIGCFKSNRWLTLESWFTNLERTPLNRCQQLPAPYKRLINDKQNKPDKPN